MRQLNKWVFSSFLNWPTVVSDWRMTVPESGSSDLEGPVTEAYVSARDHTGGDIRWAKPTAANIWDKLAVIGQVMRCWTIQPPIRPRLMALYKCALIDCLIVYEQNQLKLDTSPHRQPLEPSQDWGDMVWPAGSSDHRAAAFWTDWSCRNRSSAMPHSKALQ